MKLHIVLRTCDKKSIESKRIVDKQECVVRCFNSLAKSLKNLNIPYSVYVIDDGSSVTTVNCLRSTMPDANIVIAEQTNDDSLNAKQKSRKTVKMAYDYIMTLPEEDLVYIVEDDYLHYEDSLPKMVEAWKHFTQWFGDKPVGIFPQDFNQLHLDPRHPFNSTYVQSCFVVPGPDRYYQTTWFTHESFMVQVKLIKERQKDFYELLEIGTIDGYWEGNTISKVWKDIMMMMPLKTLAIHLGNENDISYYVTDLEELWVKNEH